MAPPIYVLQLSYLRPKLYLNMYNKPLEPIILHQIQTISSTYYTGGPYSMAKRIIEQTESGRS